MHAQLVWFFDTNFIWSSSMDLTRCWGVQKKSMRQRHQSVRWEMAVSSILNACYLLYVLSFGRLKEAPCKREICCRLKDNHNSLALYILLRGIALLIRCGNKETTNPVIHSCLAPTRWKHGDTILMCASLSQLGYSWILKPTTLPHAYVTFLNHHGGKPLYTYRALRVWPSLFKKKI